eukprot:SAG31_NODE_19695_length_594_cov_0.937374_2_plen_81_part_01
MHDKRLTVAAECSAATVKARVLLFLQHRVESQTLGCRQARSPGSVTALLDSDHVVPAAIHGIVRVRRGGADMAQQAWNGTL